MLFLSGMTMNEMRSSSGSTTTQFELDSLRFSLGEMRQNLQVSANLSASIIECAVESILITDERNIIRSVNPAFEKSTGYSAGEVIGQTPTMLKSGHHDKKFYREMWDSLHELGHWRGEIWNRNKSGVVYPEWLSISAIKDIHQQVRNYVGIFSDTVTHQDIMEHLHILAYYDGLTGLPNRRLFMDRLNMSITHARRDKSKLAVMFVDLDQFKQINDSMGHKIGDELLRRVTERMKSCLREEDTLARLAGDEFTVLLPVLPHPDAARKVAEKFMQCFSQPMQIDGHELQITASIGIGIYPDDGEDAESLIHHADIAMYRIKVSGRNGFLHYVPTMLMGEPPRSAA